MKKHETRPDTWIQEELEFEEPHRKIREQIRQSISINDDAALERRLADVMKHAKPAEFHRARDGDLQYAEGAAHLRGLLTLPEVQVLLGETCEKIQIFEHYWSDYSLHRGEKPDNELVATAHELLWKEKGEVKLRLSVDSPVESYVSVLPYEGKFYEKGERYGDRIETDPDRITGTVYRAILKILDSKADVWEEYKKLL